MDLRKIKLNDMLKIRGEFYEVIGILQTAECLPPKYEFKDILEFSLFKKRSRGITPTHTLVFYLDSREISFSGEKEKYLKESEIKIIS